MEAINPGTDALRMLAISSSAEIPPPFSTVAIVRTANRNAAIKQMILLRMDDVFESAFVFNGVCLRFGQISYSLSYENEKYQCKQGILKRT